MKQVGRKVHVFKYGRGFTVVALAPERLPGRSRGTTHNAYRSHRNAGFEVLEAHWNCPGGWHPIMTERSSISGAVVALFASFEAYLEIDEPR
jgi:hypothetical protein